MPPLLVLATLLALVGPGLAANQDDPPRPESTTPSAPIHFPDHHFTLTVPPGWTRVPGDAVAAADAEVARRVPGRNFQYIAGFSRSPHGQLAPPYVLVQVTRTGPLAGRSFDHIERELGATSIGELEQAASRSLDDVVSRVQIGRIALDRAAARTLMTFELQPFGLPPIKGLAIGHLGADQIIQLNFYDLADSFDASLPSFEAFDDGFRFDPGAQFVPGSAGSRILSGAARGALIGAAAGLLIGLGLLVRKQLFPTAR